MTENPVGWSVRKDAGRASVVFAVGTAGLYLADLILAGHLEAADLARWALFRSLVFLAAPVVLLGLDHVVVRYPRPTKSLMGLLAAQLVVVLPVAAFCLFLAGLAVTLQILGSVVSLALLLVIGGFWRSQYRVAIALVSIHLWKFVFFIAVSTAILIGWRFDARNLAFAILLIWALASVAVTTWAGARTRIDNSISLPQLYSFGLRFWAAASLSAIIAFVDQVVLNLDGTPTESATYFSYAAAILPPFLALSGLAANFANPYLRAYAADIRSRSRQLLVWFGAGGVVGVAGGVTSALVLGRWIGAIPPTINMALFVGLLLIGLLRYLYVVPSAVVGMYGTRADFDRELIFTTVSIVAGTVTYAFSRMGGVSADGAVLIFLAVSLLGRNLGGGLISRRILKSNRDLVGA